MCGERLVSTSRLTVPRAGLGRLDVPGDTIALRRGALGLAGDHEVVS